MFSFPAPDRRPSAPTRSISPPFAPEPPPKRLRDLPVDPAPDYRSAGFVAPPASLYSRFDSRLAGSRNSFADYRRGSLDYGFLHSDGLPSSLYDDSHPILEGEGSGSAFAVYPADANNARAGTPEFVSAGRGNRSYGIGRGMGAGASSFGLESSIPTEFTLEAQKIRPTLGVENSTAMEQDRFPTPTGGKKIAVKEKKAKKDPGETNETRLGYSREGTLGSFSSAIERPGRFTGSGNNDKNLVDEEKYFQAKMKTHLCKHYQAGECVFNGSCIFAHGVEELKTPVKRDDDLTAPADIVSEQEEPVPTPISAVEGKERGRKKGSRRGTAIKFDWRELQKTKICKFFVEGRCPFGRKCSFVHANEEIKPKPVFYREKPPTTRKNMHSPVVGKTGFRVKKAREETETKYDWRQLQKTKLCKFFVEGTCPFGHTCSFLHGDEELKPAQDAAGFAESSPSEKPASSKASYKTRLCPLWAKGEFCNFENKCKFAHGVQELRKHGTASSIDAPFYQVTATGDYLGNNIGAVGHFPTFSNPYEAGRTNLQLLSASQEGLGGLARDFGVRDEGRVWNSGITAANEPSIWRHSYDEPKQTSLWNSRHQLDGGYF